MTEQEIQEVISAIKKQSQPVETLEAESDVRAVSSLLAMRGDTMVRAPMALITQLLGVVTGDEDTATRALYGATMTFCGFVSGVTLKPMGLAIWDDIVYDTEKKKFLARSFLDYSAEWTLRSDYMTDEGVPRSGRVYLDHKTGVIYYWNSTNGELEPIRCDTTKSLTFSFDAVDTEWVIRHNLLRKPAVTVIDREGREVMCDIIHTSDVELRLVFGIPTAGTAILT